MKVYLMCPYSHKDRTVREGRFALANVAALYLMNGGVYVFSPISHSHPISLSGGNSLDHEFWLRQDRQFVDWADAGIVLTIDGWRESKGIHIELGWFEEMGKPVLYLNLSTWGMKNHFRLRTHPQPVTYEL